MASEFDESLLAFLQAHLGMFMQFHEHKGEFHVDLGFEGSAGPEGAGSGATLDDAINAAVEDFERKQGHRKNAEHGDLEPNSDAGTLTLVRHLERGQTFWLSREGQMRRYTAATSPRTLGGAGYGDVVLRVTDEGGGEHEWSTPANTEVLVADGAALEPNRVWTTKYKNSLPDTAFLYVRKDCVEYKEAGRSHPLDCRDLPVKNRSGAYDYAHVKNAISRAIQLEGVPMSVQKKLQAKARAIFKREFGYESED